MPDSAHDERFLRSSVVAVVAHPDDETISLSAQLAKFRQSLTILQVTDGSPRNLKWAIEAGCDSRENYAALRRREMLAALSVLGISEGQCPALGYADQEAALYLEMLASQLKELLLQLQPKFVFTHPYEGGHPDHDACAFATRAAVRMVEGEGAMPPAILEFTSYHESPDGLRVFEFLPNAGAGKISTVDLAPDHRILKQRMYDCHKSQARVLGMFPIGVERYRPAPAYDFLEPPHEGELHYERNRWGFTGVDFRRNASEALRQLEL